MSSTNPVCTHSQELTHPSQFFFYPLPLRFRPVLDAAETKGLDPQQKNEYITSMLSQSRINASLRAAYNDGEKKGMNSAKEMIAKRLQEAGFTPEQIKQATGVEL